MFSSQEEMRKYAAELFALVTVYCNPPKHIAEVIHELTTGLRNQVQSKDACHLKRHSVSVYVVLLA